MEVKDKDKRIQDEDFHYDEDEQTERRRGKPWKKDPKYFKRVKISAIALLKMVMHTSRGGKYEVMGLMTGRIEENCLTVFDVIPSPSKGNEYRVGAGNRDIEFLAGYLNSSEAVGRKEKCIGWYHSHPGFGCWLSGIDIYTQNANQKYQDPWVAVVVDPVTTLSRERVQIGAFRTFPEDYWKSQPESKDKSGTSKLVDGYGVYHKKYYSLPIKIIKSKTDSKLMGVLWNKYWVKSLSNSPLLANRAYFAEELDEILGKASILSKTIHVRTGKKNDRFESEREELRKAQSKDSTLDELQQLNADTSKFCCETLNGMIGLEIKRQIFNIQL